jgi:hypothetical protein
MALTIGSSYDPDNDIDFFLVSGFILYDYEKIWPHQAPDPLRFKVECSLGATPDFGKKIIISSGIMALYYLDDYRHDRFKPFVEAGIGIIYTDFQNAEQGSRVNFNPQLGIGTDYELNNGNTLFTAFRLHHISNGGLRDENRGINSVFILIGRYL